jgi:cobalt transporter subunit CbtB
MLNSTDVQTKTAALPKPQTATKTLSMLFAGVLGLGIIAVTGHVQAATLHDAAHDVRHATGFPCH